MKETGIIRHIDDLGRIVIPREIRKKLKISNGDTIEIYTLEDTVILKKYNPLSLNMNVIESFIKALRIEHGSNIIITDRNKVIFSTVDYVNIGKLISDDFINRCDSLVNKELNKNMYYNVLDNTKFNQNSFISKITSNYENFGFIIVLDEMINKKQIELSNIITKFLNEILNYE